MKIASVFAWLMGYPKRWDHLRRIPMRHLWKLMVSVFLLFSVIGFTTDLLAGGTLPYIIVVLFAVLAGLNAVLWIVTLARMPIVGVLALIGLEFFNGQFNKLWANWAENTFHPLPVNQTNGLRFTATCILIVVIASYSFLSRYMNATGKEAFKIKNELELAHGIQKTLVPPVSVTTACFEIYGVSHPSEKVGGDLVDVVELPDGDTVAYLADIAGHGLQAGILMGMLKTAARMALADPGDRHGGNSGGAGALSNLMYRLNVVLPQVKESHMYATFTALRLNRDGASFFGMAASPPLLHWSATDRSMVSREQEQFPLGLLPVSDFPAGPLEMLPGDVIAIATDGILEVVPSGRRARSDSAKSAVEFGTEELGRLISENPRIALPEMAEAILTRVRSYGKQFDDQTLLLVRRREG